MNVAVLGAGLQGACVALELARAGVRVDLIEQRDACLSQASAANEGKLHLGFVYANDPGLETARTMIRGALRFAPLLRRWIGDAVDRIPVSSPFHYVVHPDSMLDVDTVQAHLDACHRILVETAGATPDYFGSDPRTRPRRLRDTECAALFDATAAFHTPEIAIDSEVLAVHVREALAAAPGIDVRLRTRVVGVERHADGATVLLEHEGAETRADYDHVVNALWDGRLAIDATAGIAPQRPWLYRLKDYVRLRAPNGAEPPPSTTIVLGPFGDVVAYAGGELYLSWYPVGMRETSSELVAPAWSRRDPAGDDRLRRETHAGLLRTVRGLAAVPHEGSRVGGGVIVAWGRTDIDDHSSGLHERWRIGPRSTGRYHSIDTGKLTTAPLFAETVAHRILATA